MTGESALEDTPTAEVDLARIRDTVDLVRRAAPTAVVGYAMKASYYRPVIDAVLAAGTKLAAGSPWNTSSRGGPGSALPTSSTTASAGLPTSSGQPAMQAPTWFESLPELEGLARLRQNRPDREVWTIGLRLAVGDAGSKYELLGLPPDVLPEAASTATAAGLRIGSVGFHAFANRTGPEGHIALVKRLAPVIEDLGRATGAAVTHVDVGGGLVRGAGSPPTTTR